MKPDIYQLLKTVWILISWLLIRIHTVFNARCELIIINQNMKYRIVLTFYIVLVQGQVNRNFRLVLNEMGPGQISPAWYFHSPDILHYSVLRNTCTDSIHHNYHMLLNTQPITLLHDRRDQKRIRKPKFGIWKSSKKLF